MTMVVCDVRFQIQSACILLLECFQKQLGLDWFVEKVTVLRLDQNIEKVELNVSPNREESLTTIII